MGELEVLWVRIQILGDQSCSILSHRDINIWLMAEAVLHLLMRIDSWQLYLNKTATSTIARPQTGMR